MDMLVNMLDIPNTCVSRHCIHVQMIGLIVTAAQIIIQSQAKTAKLFMAILSKNLYKVVSEKPLNLHQPILVFSVALSE